MTDSATLTEGSIARHLMMQTLPMMLGISCIMGVGLLDAFFIGQLGAEPLAAVSFIFPVSMALSSLGVGVMVGVNSVVSRAIGAGDQSIAGARAVQGVALAAIIGIVIAVSLLLGYKLLFRSLQAPEHLMPLISEYIVPYAISLPALLTAMGANGVLRAQGEAVKSSSILIVVAIVNGILDPLLIFGIGPFPHWGVAGAGWATAFANLFAMGVGLAFVSTCALPLNFRRLIQRGATGGAGELVKVGAPAAIANAINPVGIALLTALLARHGQDAVAGFGTAGRLQSVAAVPLLALSSSIGPIVGQNWGAGKRKRTRQALMMASAFCVVYGLFIALFLSFFRESIAAWFTDSVPIAKQIAQYLLIASWGYFGFGLLVVANGALNAVDRAGLALQISLARVALVMLPLGWFATRSGDPSYVYGAELTANVLGGLAAGWLANRCLSPPTQRGGDGIGVHVPAKSQM